ncbi:alpha/beta fold hydrolase, partial [Silvanigrella aquatica]|uniref:alpha/beta fold hydrolase n=1 Tax=Silvanigrella aquatica TaxID=1915309 RepID=UPI001E354245
MITLHFIHGFLGFSSDWDIFKEDFKKYNSVFYSISKYMTSSNKQENSSFILWASNFNKSALKNKVNQKNILIGYSLGGRLALHTLIESNRWDAAIIISANPGLKSESEKLARIANDNSWANRFQNENWNDVINAWNSQGVFSNMQNTLSREEKLFNKTEVVNILKEFS